MNEDFDYSIVPGNFVFCLNSRCPRADECMSHLLAAHAIETQETLTVVNPTAKAETCRYFYPHEKVNFGLGITHLFDKMPYATAVAIKERIIYQFNKPTFYRWKRKERLVSPEEQDAIRRIFHEEGITDEPVYDQLVKRYVWQTSVLKEWRQ
jgi:hypothetical protein